MEDGLFTGEALGGGPFLFAAETAKHSQRSADDGQGGYAQAQLGEETAAGLAGLLLGFHLVGQVILLPVRPPAGAGWLRSHSPDHIARTT